MVLFKYLPEEAPICKIIKIRNMEPHEIKDINLKKYRDSILLDPETEQDELIKFANSL